MPAFGNRILTTTQQYIMPKCVDTVLNSNVLAQRLIRNAKKWRGERIKFPVKFQKNNTGTSFSGFDTFAVQGVNTRVNMEYYPSFYRIGVTLPLDELSVNDTEDKVLDLMELEVESASQDMADDIGSIFFGDGSGNNSKDFNGLTNLVDDGTSSTTIGALTRATYPTLNSTVTASGGSISLAKMSTLYNAISSGSITPTLGVTTKAVFALYESLLAPQERVVKDVSMMKYDAKNGLNSGTGLIGGTGFTGLFYKGFPILADEKCTSGVLFFLNENYLDFYALPVAQTESIKYKNVVDGNDYDTPIGLGFSWSGWIKVPNSAVITSNIYLGGQLTVRNPKRMGKLTSITSV